MAIKIVVVCEAQADFVVASEIADRLVCDRIKWIEPETLDSFRTFCGLENPTVFTTWANIARLARNGNLRVRGHFDGQPAAPDAHAARRAIKIVLRELPDTDTILLIRDDDRQTARRQGLEQARSESIFSERIIIGLAHCKRECWVLSGFVALDDREVRLLNELRSELGFDPCSTAGNLTASHFQDLRSAKRVLSVLTGGIWEREVRCWRDTSLAVMRERGVETGLADFIAELESRLLPLLGGR